MFDGLDEPLSGVIEVDETYVGSRTRRGHPTVHERIKDEEEMGLRPKTPRKAPLEGKTPVFGMIERGGGRVRTQVVPVVRGETLRPIMLQGIDLDRSVLMSDGHPAYRRMKEFLPHELEYVRGEVHTQSIENNWSIFKRGVTGVFHHIGKDYLPMYLSEFDFRGSRRRISDSERFVSLLGQTQGRLLWYCQTSSGGEPLRLGSGLAKKRIASPEGHVQLNRLVLIQASSPNTSLNSSSSKSCCFRAIAIQIRAGLSVLTPHLFDYVIVLYGELCDLDGQLFDSVRPAFYVI